MTILAHGDMVTNILAVYDRATDAQRGSGASWYPSALRIVEAIAIETLTDPERVCYALAALSPRNPWRWNVADCYSFAEARAQGRTMPTATTFNRNKLRAWQALGADGHPWLTEAPKVRAFVKAIMGDSEAVVVDTWAYRVATNAAPDRRGSFNLSEYKVLAHAYNVAANLRGIEPRTMQAVTWLVAQTEGLASHRRGDHSATFKAGTPDFVRALLA